MVHTFEMIHHVSEAEMEKILPYFCSNEAQIHKFFLSNKKSKALEKAYIAPGFKKILFVKRTDDLCSNSNLYYCIVRLEPLAFLLGKRTVDLFWCTDDNVRMLSDQFYQVMRGYLPEQLKHLCTIENWNCRRIDYTQNLQFASTVEADLFIQLCKKTSQHSRTRSLSDKEHGAKQSMAEGNKSIKFMIYLKQKQIREQYTDISKVEKEQLLQASEGIARLEVQCKKPKIQTLSKQFKSKSIMNYLDEELSVQIINQYARKAIGSGDFYSFYHAQKKIKQSGYKPAQKEKLIKTLQLIAQARHVDVAKQQFVLGTKIKNTDMIIQGTAATFDKRLKEFEALQINPVLIPKDWKAKNLRNPLSNRKLKEI